MLLVQGKMQETLFICMSSFKDFCKQSMIQKNNFTIHLTAKDIIGFHASFLEMC